MCDTLNLESITKNDYNSVIIFRMNWQICNVTSDIMRCYLILEPRFFFFNGCGIKIDNGLSVVKLRIGFCYVAQLVTYLALGPIILVEIIGLARISMWRFVTLWVRVVRLLRMQPLKGNVGLREVLRGFVNSNNIILIKYLKIYE